MNSEMSRDAENLNPIGHAIPADSLMRTLVLVAGALVALSGCMTEAQHIHPTTLPDGKPGYIIVCNSQRYDRCLNRAAKVCNGAYTIVPQARDTVRLGDPVAGIGSSESILVSCGK